MSGCRHDIIYVSFHSVALIVAINTCNELHIIETSNTPQQDLAILLLLTRYFQTFGDRHVFHADVENYCLKAECYTKPDFWIL